MSSISNNLEKLRCDIQRYAKSAKRNPAQIHLIAVSKTHSNSSIEEVYSKGQTEFGENYVKELVQKSLNLRLPKIHWHFIGHLQRNKINSLIPHIHYLHTLDRFNLAQSLNEKLISIHKILPVLIEVKISADQYKTGVTIDTLFDFVVSLKEYTHLKLEGLMMVASSNTSEAVTRLEMQQLRELKSEINRKNLYPTPLSQLSMGMSHDYPIAIEEGATFLRIGSTIFGSRNSEES